MSLSPSRDKVVCSLLANMRDGHSPNRYSMIAWKDSTEIYKTCLVSETVFYAIWSSHVAPSSARPSDHWPWTWSTWKTPLYNSMWQNIPKIFPTFGLASSMMVWIGRSLISPRPLYVTFLYTHSTSSKVRQSSWFYALSIRYRSCNPTFSAGRMVGIVWCSKRYLWKLEW